MLRRFAPNPLNFKLSSWTLSKRLSRPARRTHCKLIAYLKHLKAHSQRYLATEPGTLKFEIAVPHGQPDTVMLYEVYASPEAFETHWNGPAKKVADKDLEPLRASASAVRCDVLE
jgi:quinol monooxygenase YgiN